MTKDTFTKEKKAAKSLIKRYPLIKSMWREREKIFDEAYKKEAQVESKYNRAAKKAGLKSVRFAYAESCFGIDVNNVYLNRTNIREDRLLVHDFILSKPQT